jgi:hypothetical protein
MGARSSPTTSRYGMPGTGQVSYETVDDDSILLLNDCILCCRRFKVGSVAIKIKPYMIGGVTLICNTCLLTILNYCPDDYTDDRFSKLVDWAAVG